MSSFSTSETSTTTLWSATRKTNCFRQSKSVFTRKLARTCLFLEYQLLRLSRLPPRKKMWAKEMWSCQISRSKSRMRTSLMRKRSRLSSRKMKKRRWAQKRSNYSPRKGTQAWSLTTSISKLWLVEAPLAKYRSCRTARLRRCLQWNPWKSIELLKLSHWKRLN